MLLTTFTSQTFDLHEHGQLKATPFVSAGKKQTPSFRQKPSHLGEQLLLHSRVGRNKTKIVRRARLIVLILKSSCFQSIDELFFKYLQLYCTKKLNLVSSDVPYCKSILENKLFSAFGFEPSAFRKSNCLYHLSYLFIIVNVVK